MNDEADEVTSAQDEIEFLRDAPVESILGSHIFHLIQLAAVHLAATPPHLDEARLCIDVASAMVNAGGDRLGEHVGLYRNALAEVQQVFVRASTSPPTTE
ncbi:MAG TPA: hypothetical protein VND83_06650 [Acidimicrobiales bacterium]|nr:hypothetical protein [Acidimicrobiales bacterium]